MTEIEKLYSEAFNDGVEYAQRMYGVGDFFKSGWEKAKGLANKGVEDFKNADWKGKTWRAAIPTAAVAIPTALAIRSHRKKKAAEAEAEKNYSEGFLDGVDYAQKMFEEGAGDPAATQNTDPKSGDTGKKTDTGAKKDNIFKRGWNKLTNDIWEKDKGWRDETTNEAGEKIKNINWKRAGKRAAVIAVPTAAVAVPTALAIKHHRAKSED
jgi:hypothetical protein